MKNLLIREDKTALWISAAVTGVVAAGAGIWFYLHGKRAAAAELEAYQHEHAQDYLEVKHPHKKKHKTDVHDLKDIVHHQQL